MNYAVKLVNFPQQIFAAAIATVIFPLLAAWSRATNRARRRRTRSLVTGLRAGELHHDSRHCARSIVLASPDGCRRSSK